MMPIAFINSQLGNHCSNSKIKETTCECWTLTTLKAIIQSFRMAWVNTKGIFFAIDMNLTHEFKNHKLFVCCKISPPSNQQLIHNHSYIEMLQKKLKFMD